MIAIPLSEATSRRLRMPELATHLVLVGPAGSGKSYTVRTLVREYTQADQPNGRRVYAYDMKTAGFTAATVLDVAQHGLRVMIGTPEPASPVLVVLDHLARLEPVDEARLIDLLTQGAGYGVHVVLAVDSLDGPVVSPTLREAIEQRAEVRTTPLPGMFYASTDGGPARLVVADWMDPDQVVLAGVNLTAAQAVLAELAAAESAGEPAARPSNQGFDQERRAKPPADE